MQTERRLSKGACAALCLLMASGAEAGSRIIGTGGVTQVEGAAGGGLVPWAVLAGTASDGEWAATGAYSHAEVKDYSLAVRGVALNWSNRLELSYARQHFALDTLGGYLKQDVYGAKVRLFGDILYSPYGQWSLGAQYKENRTFDLPKAVGAEDSQGTDFYLSGATYLFGAAGGYNLFLNGTLRATKANQLGLLGFGGDREDGYKLQAEASAAVFLNFNWAVGAEYRQKPDNLGFAEEQDAWDLFVAYIPSKHLSLTAAYVDLGDIAGLQDQSGYYLSLQGAF